MHIVLTGGTGFLGRALIGALLQRGDRCTVISRSGRDLWHTDAVRVIRADPTRPGEWQRAVAGVDAVVNLAGERVVHPLHPWTAARKATLLASRVETARRVAEAVRSADPRPRVLVSASGINYYGSHGAERLEEDAPPGDDFLARLCVAWEAAARTAADVTHVAVVRTGVVLAADAPVLAPMLPFFRLGLGGSWGDGRGWWSWIHLADYVGLVLLALDGALEGPLNLTAPHPVTVDDFTAALGRALHRPVLLRMPAVGLRLALGEAADALLHLQRVVPASALAAGYEFRFPTLEQALANIF
jgi:uncharacterized protein (TIGR01777 family)